MTDEIRESLDYLTRDIKDIKTKPYIKVALASHLKKMRQISEKEATTFVEEYINE